MLVVLGHSFDLGIGVRFYKVPHTPRVDKGWSPPRVRLPQILLELHHARYTGKSVSVISLTLVNSSHLITFEIHY